MPITKSAKKALRQSIHRRAQNLKKKEAYKEAAKAVRKFFESGKEADAAAYLPKLYKALDKAAKTCVIKANKASRIKSRLTKLLQKTKTA